MRYIIFIAAIVAFITGGCAADQVNYLNTEHTMYAPDTVVFKSVLDPDDWDDARRAEFEIPWQSSGLQGVDAGLPLDYRIVSVRCDNPANGKFTDQFYMTAVNGVIGLPLKHTVPLGKYTFSVELSNECGRNRAILHDALTIIIE